MYIMHAHMEARRQTQLPFLSTTHLFFETRSLPGLELNCRLFWMIREPQTTSCCCVLHCSRREPDWGVDGMKSGQTHRHNRKAGIRSTGRWKFSVFVMSD